MNAPRVAILADDLIWSTRLTDAVREAGGEPVVVRSALALADAIEDVDRVVVDLTARAYDGLEAIATAARAGRPVLAVGQHDDHDLRRRALSAGADRVLAYRKLFADGPATLAAWFRRAGPGDGA